MQKQMMKITWLSSAFHFILSKVQEMHDNLTIIGRIAFARMYAAQHDHCWFQIWKLHKWSFLLENMHNSAENFCTMAHSEEISFDRKFSRKSLLKFANGTFCYISMYMYIRCQICNYTIHLSTWYLIRIT